MRIGIFDPYLDDLGGGEKYMLTIAECLAKEHDVRIFWDNEEDITELKKRFSFSLDTVKLTKNIFSPHVGMVERLQATHTYDAIFFLSDGSIPMSLSPKLFLHVQQPLEHVDSSFIAKCKLSRVTQIFYNSSFTKSYNEKKFGDVKSSVIYPPVDMYNKDTKKENIILHVGRFRVFPPRPTGLPPLSSRRAPFGPLPQEGNNNVEDYKKQGVMIEAFKKMVDDGLKDWKFVILAGVKKEDEEAFAKLRDAAKGYPIEFLVNKPNEDLWNAYNSAKIYWHASGFGEDLEKHPENAEHFGISTVEAMGAGAVPVVINAGGQKEIVTDGENGLLWSTLEELQEKTLSVIKDNELWKNLSISAQRKSQQFGRERFCHEIGLLLRG